MYGERLKFLRKKASLSQADLADKTGVARPNISFWENSDFPPLEAIDKVCRALGLETWEFFIDDNELAQKHGIPGGFGDLMREIASLDAETREQLRALFSMMVRVVASKDAACAKPLPDENRVPPVVGPAVPEPEEHNEGTKISLLARTALPVAVEDYMQRFMWLTNAAPDRRGRVQ